MTDDAFDLVIFGGRGDLSCKKLLPALYSGFRAGSICKESRIYLTTRSKPSEDTRTWLGEVFGGNVPSCGLDDAVLSAFAEIVTILPLGLTDPDHIGWAALQKDIEVQQSRPVIHFLAIPPKLFTGVCAALSHHGLNSDQCRVVLEKPLGHDLESAQEINTQVAEYFTEKQTFRIDHYLGKEAVQNLLALRFSNILFEKLWNSETIDHIQITIAEDLGLVGRGGYYEGVGAMRDMVQNHLLQLLCLVAMEPPANLDGDGIREEKLKVLKALQGITPEIVKNQVVRGQYTAGAMGGEAVGSYNDDVDLDVDSTTETYVAIKTFVENWRWAGVPFYLRTGKRLPDRFADIMIQFKDVPHNSNKNWHDRSEPNRFIIRLQPEDHLALRMMVKNHAQGEDALKEEELNLDVTDPNRLGPYLRLILAASKGDQSLFVHRDEVEYAWRWVDGIIAEWEASGTKPLPYTAGTWGPYEAHSMMNNDGRKWFGLNS